MYEIRNLKIRAKIDIIKGTSDLPNFTFKYIAIKEEGLYIAVEIRIIRAGRKASINFFENKISIKIFPMIAKINIIVISQVKRNKVPYFKNFSPFFSKNFPVIALAMNDKMIKFISPMLIATE
jgi:hypothetical protein